MLKLYRNNEVLFAVAWIVVYVIVCGSLRSLGDDSPAMTAGLLGISLAAALFVRRNGLADKYGLDGWAKDPRRMLWFVPLWVIASGNLWGGADPHYAMPGLAFDMVSMGLVGFAEELVFRGFLFKAMLASGGERAAIAVSSVTFGMGHIVNLLNGQATADTIVQIVYAVVVGLVFTLVFLKGGSLWPCIIAHSMIDVFSVVSARGNLFDLLYLAIALVCAVVYCVYLTRLETPPAEASHDE